MKNKSTGYVLALIAAVILTGSGSAWPQYQARLEGVVKDSTGAPIAGVAVTVVSVKAASMYFDLKTDSEGKFSQIGMMPGYYQVSFKKDGFQPKSAEIHVRIADVTKIETILEKGAEIIDRALSDADRLFLKGNNLFEEKRYEEAVSTFQEAINLNPANWGYYLNLGLAFKKLDKQDDALASFRKAVELNPESYSSNKELGEALAKTDAFEEAVGFYEKAIGLSPEDPDAFFNFGACLINVGRTDEALTCFLKTTELKADYADAYYQIGTINIGLNKVPEAVAALEKFLTLAPDHEKAPLAKQLLEYLKK